MKLIFFKYSSHSFLSETLHKYGVVILKVCTVTKVRRSVEVLKYGLWILNDSNKRSSLDPKGRTVTKTQTQTTKLITESKSNHTTTLLPSTLPQTPPSQIYFERFLCWVDYQSHRRTFNEYGVVIVMYISRRNNRRNRFSF